MPRETQHRARVGNWRLDSVGRLVEKYRGNAALNACWDAAITAGIPAEECPPEGATNPRASVPSDSLFSEFILRAFEAAYDKPNANDPFPSAGFKANLRAIAEALETACRLAAEGFGVSEFPVGLIPLHWLKDAAELAYYRAEPGKPNPLAEMDREMRAEVNQYPYLSVLWSAWYPVYLETRPEILGWN
jgi:hypothetical protein